MIKGGRISIHHVSVGADMKHAVHSQQEDDTSCTQHNRVIMADAFTFLPKVCSEITCQRSAQKLPAKGQHCPSQWTREYNGTIAHVLVYHGHTTPRYLTAAILLYHTRQVVIARVGVP